MPSKLPYGNCKEKNNKEKVHCCGDGESGALAGERKKVNGDITFKAESGGSTSNGEYQTVQNCNAIKCNGKGY